MAVNENEGFLEKAKDFFWQKPGDRSYEEQGGDDRVPEGERTSNPRKDARNLAVAEGEEDPYPEDGPLDGPQPA